MKINIPEFTVTEPDLTNGTNLSFSLEMLREQLNGLELTHDLRVKLDGLCNSIDQSAKSIEEALRFQKHKIAEVEKLAQTDELTRILNRRGFVQQLNRTLAAAERYNEKNLLAFIDLDGFKPVNDTLGHLAGDEVLQSIARILSENIRTTDFVGRVGGDEFAIVLSRTCPDQGMDRIETLDQVVNSSFAMWEGKQIQLRASFGTYIFGAGDDANAIIAAADQNMYESKRLSRDFSFQAAFA